MTECKQEVFKFQGQGSAAGSFCRPHEHALDGFQPTAVVVQRVCAPHALGAAGRCAARYATRTGHRGTDPAQTLQDRRKSEDQLPAHPLGAGQCLSIPRNIPAGMGKLVPHCLLADKPSENLAPKNVDLSRSCSLVSSSKEN